jgi:hypothetical protein
MDGTQLHMWQSSLTYPAEPACSTTSLPATSSDVSAPGGSPERRAPVWVQLYIDAEKEGDPLSLTFTKRSKRHALSVAKMVKKECSEMLQRISAAKLTVHAWNDKRFTRALHPQEPIAEIHGGNSSNCPIIVGAAKRKSTRKMLASIWYQLYIDNKKFGRSWKLKLERGANVADVATAVKNEYTKVVDVISGGLSIHEWNDSTFCEVLDPATAARRAQYPYSGIHASAPYSVMALTTNQSIGTFI